MKAVPGNYKYFGCYLHDRKEVLLATSEETIFFHELAHAAHEKVKGYLKGGQNPSQEIVAELAKGKKSPPCYLRFVSEGQPLIRKFREAHHHGTETYVALRKVQSLLHRWPKVCRSIEIPSPASAQSK